MSCDESDIFRTAPTSRYSADVEIELFMNGQRFPVGQIGRGVMIFDQPVQLPATTGQLVLTIDGHPRRWSITVRGHSAPARIINADFRDAS